MVHSCQQSRDRVHDRSYGMKEEAVHEVRLIAASPDCRPEMHGHRFASVLDVIRAENRLEHHSNRVGKSRAAF